MATDLTLVPIEKAADFSASLQAICGDAFHEALCLMDAYSSRLLPDHVYGKWNTAQINGPAGVSLLFSPAGSAMITITLQTTQIRMVTPAEAGHILSLAWWQNLAIVRPEINITQAFITMRHYGYATLGKELSGLILLDTHPHHKTRHAHV